MKEHTKQYENMLDLVKKLESTNQKLRKEKEQTAKLAIIGEKMSQINHNLRNPLNVIFGNAQIINTIAKQNNDTKNFVRSNDIMNAVNLMLNQINDLMSFIRKETLELEHKSLKEILEKSISLIKKPKKIEIQIPENDIMCRCDPAKMQVVFMNLFTNAIDALGGIGKIIIRNKQLDNEIIIEVEDSGEGISEDTLPKIFDVLFTTKRNGTGLGLPYCKSIIEQHGGIIFASINPTVFTIILPQ